MTSKFSWPKRYGFSDVYSPSVHLVPRSGIPSVTKKVLDNHTNEVWYITFSHDGKYLASGSADSRIIIWNLEVRKANDALGCTSFYSRCAYTDERHFLDLPVTDI